MKSLAKIIAPTVLALPMLLPAVANAASIDTMSASFTGTIGGSSVNGSAVSGYNSGAAFLNWGSTVPHNPNLQSGMVYEGVSMSGVTVHDGLTASIGTITFRNQTIDNGPIQQTTLNVGIGLGSGASYNTTLSWTFTLTETPNNLMPTAFGGSCPGPWSPSSGCGDIMSVSGASTSDVITIDGQKFEMEIAGFMTPGASGPMDQFLLFENSVTSADLMITFHQVDEGGVAHAPIPGALPMFLSALGGLGAFRYRRRNKA